jgi:hypothetical protein
MQNMKVLDLFAGLGGFSEAFVKNGCTVHTLDNGAMEGLGDTKWTFNKDIREFHCKPGEYDVILIGLPCQPYSRWGMRGLIAKNWKHKKSPIVPEPDNALLKEAMRIVNECKPKYWALENVHGGVTPISQILGRPKLRVGFRWFWGNFPLTQADVKHEWYKKKFTPRSEKQYLGHYSRTTPATRSKIEFEISEAFWKSMVKSHTVLSTSGHE